MPLLRASSHRWLAAATIGSVAALVSGAVLGWWWHPIQDPSWMLGAGIGIIVCTAGLVNAVRQRRLGVDVIALLALAAALLIHEFFAACVLSVMLSSGGLLEAFASYKARQELSALTTRAPTFARRIVEGNITVTEVADVTPGDQLMLAAGDIVPVDGVIITGGRFDESSLTGEALPVRKKPGEAVASGIVNLDAGTHMHATGTAESSTYAAIVALVRQAQASSAPFVRLADRWALWFIPLTLGMAGLAWLLDGSVRAVSVLVIATPCPLILAAPIAIMSGIGHAARQGVIIKGGGALEVLARTNVLLMDKTGTLTEGRPRVTEVFASHGSKVDVLETAASLEQFSTHVLAPTVVEACVQAGGHLAPAHDIDEVHGSGIVGSIADSKVRVGSYQWLADSTDRIGAQWRASARNNGSSQVFVERDGTLIGAISMQDPVRSGLAETLDSLRRFGVHRFVLITGDHQRIAHSVAQMAGIDVVHADVRPADKLAIVKREKVFGTTAMVGDGINDAPALAGADVGIAMAARGASAASQAADIVLVHERFEALVDAMATAQRSMTIAWQSVVVGMTLSLIGMAAAGAGWLTPTAGAVTQEGIDLLAIAIALRATRPLMRLQVHPLNDKRQPHTESSHSPARKHVSVSDSRHDH